VGPLLPPSSVAVEWRLLEVVVVDRTSPPSGGVQGLLAIDSVLVLTEI
jgi:hypothetical protein